MSAAHCSFAQATRAEEHATLSGSGQTIIYAGRGALEKHAHTRMAANTDIANVAVQLCLLPGAVVPPTRFPDDQYHPSMRGELQIMWQAAKGKNDAGSYLPQKPTQAKNSPLPPAMNDQRAVDGGGHVQAIHPPQALERSPPQDKHDSLSAEMP